MELVYEILMPALATIFTGLASWGVSALVAWINTKIKNENLQRALTTAEGVISATVKEVTQTYVDDLKKAGKFDDKAKKAAFDKAVAEIEAQLTETQRAALQSVCNDVEAYIKTLIESKIKEG